MKKRNQSRDHNLYERIAKALGWSIEETQSFSLQSLRELVRPSHPKLAYVIDDYIRSDESYITGRRRKPGRARLTNLAHRLKNP